MKRQGRQKDEWVQTYSGRVFWPLDPKVEEIDIEDIAHSLSNQCRFSGHCLKFYCPTPDQRILTADLQWVPAGEIEVGTKVLGFDEYPTEVGSTGKKRRRFRPAVVTHTQPVKREVIKLTIANGDVVRCTEEHPWLIATKMSRNQKWVTAKEIAKALSEGRKRYLHKFVSPWKYDNSHEAGWLAGMYDGEGFVSIKDRRGVLMGVSQLPGSVMDKLVELHKMLGYEVGYSVSLKSGVAVLQTLGGWRGVIKLLGAIRPVRLLEKFALALEGGQFNKQMDGIKYPFEIVSAVYEGKRWCSGIETSTHTYICEGFGAHNSVAQHSVLVSDRCGKNALWGLLHDASEAYLVDMPRPIKQASRLGSEYRRIEKLVMKAVCERYGLPIEEPQDVIDADNLMLSWEQRDLMAPAPMPWHTTVPVPNITKIIPYGPEEAKTLFLTRFRELTRKH